MIGATSSYISQLYQQTGTIMGDNSSVVNRPVTPQENINPVQPPEETVQVSEEGRRLARRNGDDQSSGTNQDGAGNQSPNNQTEELSYNDQAVLTKLQARDTEVRAHERAHLAAAGQYARGGASFTYQRGPDGRLYAVGGEVSIDIGRENTPEATIAKMQTVKRAALAPASPSAADRQIAAQATAELSRAQQELNQQRMEETQSTNISDAESSQPTATVADPLSVYSGATNATRSLMVEAYQAVNELL